MMIRTLEEQRAHQEALTKQLEQAVTAREALSRDIRTVQAYFSNETLENRVAAREAFWRLAKVADATPGYSIVYIYTEPLVAENDPKVQARMVANADDI